MTAQRSYKLMNPCQRKFFRLYLGKDDRFHGHGTECYKAVYGVTSDTVAQTSASRLLKNPKFRAFLDKAEADALAELQVNAGYVLKKSVQLLDRSMGDAPITTVKSKIDKATGKERFTVAQNYDYDPRTAKAALQLIGQHKDVQAFTQVVEHTHTVRLEQRLAAKQKAIEGRAISLPDDTRGIPEITAQQEDSKRVHIDGGYDETESEKGKNRYEIDGATADKYTP